MSGVVGESTCRHCKQLIRKISEHPVDPGRWYHIDGHHARIECKGLVAEPMPGGEGGIVRDD